MSNSNAYFLDIAKIKIKQDSKDLNPRSLAKTPQTLNFINAPKNVNSANALKMLNSANAHK